MIKFNLLQHQKLNYLITERKNTAEDLFSDEADTDMKHLSYVFILNCNSSNIADNSLADTLNQITYDISECNSHNTSDNDSDDLNKDMRLNIYEDS